jgi:Lsr2
VPRRLVLAAMSDVLGCRIVKGGSAWWAPRNRVVAPVVSLQYLLVHVDGMSLSRHETTRLVDDLDGSDAVATVSFSLDGLTFEIDLSEGHLAEFRAVMKPFVTAARRVSGGDDSRRAAGRSAARAAVSSGASGEVPPGRGASGNGSATAGRPDGARSTVMSEPGAVAAAPATVTPPPASGQDETAPRPERKRAPLVADPFNPQVRIV